MPRTLSQWLLRKAWTPGSGADQTPPPQGPGPRGHPIEVGRVVAGGVEGADRLADGLGVGGGASAGQGHGLVDHGHAGGHLARLDAGQPAVGQGLDLEVDVTETAGQGQGPLGPFGQHRRVVDLAAQGGEGHPSLLDARLVGLHQSHRPVEPGAGRHLVAHHVLEQLTEAGRHQRRRAVVPGRGQAAQGVREVGHGGLGIAAGHGLLRQGQQPSRLVDGIDRCGVHGRRLASGWCPEGRWGTRPPEGRRAAPGHRGGPARPQVHRR
jgi:hypothetical protein